MKKSPLFTALTSVILLAVACGKSEPPATRPALVSTRATAFVSTKTSAQASILTPTDTPAATPTSLPTATFAPKPELVIETRLSAAERAAIFEQVWQAVNNQFFDPTFSGRDWKAIGETYRQKLEAVEDDHTFWLELLNPMLFELGVSHLAALPAEFTSQVDPMTFATGTLGLDVRLLEGRMVVTRVDKGSPAEAAGLRPGFEITAVDGLTLDDLAAVTLLTPPFNERHRRGSMVQSLRARLYGEAGKQVMLDYRDAADRPQHDVIQFARRAGACDQLDSSMPPACAELEVKQLENGIGYLRFSGFLSAVREGVLQAIRDFHDAPGLIIDLRGNPGGQFFVRRDIASLLVGEAVLFMRYQHRDSIEEIYLDPVPDAYPGDVAILVDELSASSSEEFAGSLQSLGRVKVIGTQTPGICLVMDFVPLSEGAVLTVPYGQSQTPDGRVLEGNGVMPDIMVELDRQQLLQGYDAQLAAAIDYLLALINK